MTLSDSCFFKQKTAYEMRISDWSSDVCSSDLADLLAEDRAHRDLEAVPAAGHAQAGTLGDAARQQRVVGEYAMYRCRVGIQIEQSAHAAHQVGDRARVGAVNEIGRAHV